MAYFPGIHNPGLTVAYPSLVSLSGDGFASVACTWHDPLWRAALLWVFFLWQQWPRSDLVWVVL